MNKLLKPSVLMSALLTLVVFLPDSDSFAAQFSVAPHLLDYLIVIDDNKLSSVYGKILVAMLLGLSMVYASGWLGCKRLKPMIIGTAVLIGYGFLRLQMGGMPTGSALRTAPLMGIYIMLLTTVAVCGFSRDIGVRFGLALGFVASGAIKLVYSVYCFRRYGGVQIFEGTSALVMDGGVLIQWVVISGAASLYGLHCCRGAKSQRGALLFMVSMVFSAAVAASFRRTALVLVLGNLGLAVIIYFWLRRKLLSGIFWMGGISLAAGLGLFVVMASVFGFTTAYERILSLSKTSNKANAFSDSNELYLDDQKALVDILVVTRFAGTGPGVPYGVSRLSDEFSNERYVPLHTGMTELWASFGIVGLAYHLLILFLLPLSCVLSYRKALFDGGKGLPEAEIVPVALAAGYILLSAFWPFAPPFYFNSQTSIILGICFGYLLSVSSRANSSSRSKTGQLLPRGRPLASVPA